MGKTMNKNTQLSNGFASNFTLTKLTLGATGRRSSPHHSPHRSFHVCSDVKISNHLSPVAPLRKTPKMDPGRVRGRHQGDLRSQRSEVRGRKSGTRAVSSGL